jgi:protein required for attachment to host cells
MPGNVRSGVAPDQGAYVIANASRARLLERTAGQDDWADVADLVHAQSRRPAASLAHDRPGHIAGSGPGSRGSTFQPRTDPRQLEHERFARQIAETVDAAVLAGRCRRLVLVASDPFLGVLHAQLGPQSRKAVHARIGHDWTTLPDAELVRKLLEADVDG